MHERQRQIVATNYLRRLPLGVHGDRANAVLAAGSILLLSVTLEYRTARKWLTAIVEIIDAKY
jgi:hypothetical protein